MPMWHRSVGLSQHMNITAGALHALPLPPSSFVQSNTRIESSQTAVLKASV